MLQILKSGDESRVLAVGLSACGCPLQGKCAVKSLSGGLTTCQPGSAMQKGCRRGEACCWLPQWGPLLLRSSKASCCNAVCASHGRATGLADGAGGTCAGADAPAAGRPAVGGVGAFCSWLSAKWSANRAATSGLARSRNRVRRSSGVTSASLACCAPAAPAGAAHAGPAANPLCLPK